MIDAASLALVACSTLALAAGWAWAVRRTFRALDADGCPACAGFGTLRTGRRSLARCDDCGGEGAAAALVPDHVPAHWTGGEERQERA